MKLHKFLLHNYQNQIKSKYFIIKQSGTCLAENWRGGDQRGGVKDSGGQSVEAARL